MKKLNKREMLFCCFFASGRNGREAAYKAGYSVCPELAAKRLLSDKRITDEIRRIASSSDETIEEVKAGLRRIAFSSSADAVKLLFDENICIEDIEGLDLFNIAEIKKPKTGGIEIKFFDRIKALEKLGECDGGNEKDAQTSFYTALEKSASVLGGDDRS